MVSMRAPVSSSRKALAEERHKEQKEAAFQGPGRKKALGAKKRVAVSVGKSGRRVTIELPRSLEALRRKARELFPEYASRRFECYVVKEKRGRGGQQTMHVKVSNEAAYYQILDDDLVILVAEVAEGWAEPPRTTMQADYLAHPLQAVEAAGPKASGPFKPTKFYGQSTYEHDYKPHEGRFASKPAHSSVQRTTASGPFEGASTYQVDYVQHPLLAREPRDMPDDRANVKGDPFNHRSSYATDFPPHHGLFKSKACDPGNHGFRGGRGKPEPMTSTYQAEFLPLDVSLRSYILRPQTTNAHGANPFQGQSTYTRDYTKKEYARRAFIHVEPAPDKHKKKNMPPRAQTRG